MHKLMIKTHNQTGLKYLCYTRKEGEEYDNYKGSGKKWLRHLSKYGDTVTTELIFETEDKDEFIQYARAVSIEYGIVESTEWANLRVEEGDGGDTVSKKMWINNGEVDKYHDKSEPIPEGWVKGRCKCVFNDIEMQKEFNSRVDRKKSSAGIRRAWAEGRFDKRDHSKCGAKGDANVAKRPEVREKIAGYVRSEETKQRMSLARKGKTLYTDGNVRKFFNTGQQPEGWVQGTRK